MSQLRDPNSRIQHSLLPRKRPLDPVDILNDAATSCSRAEDPAFWVLTSAAAHLNGYDLDDGQESSVDCLLASSLWFRRCEP